MNKTRLITCILFVSASLYGCSGGEKVSQEEKPQQEKPQQEKPQQEDPQQTVETDKESVKDVVKGFGSKLQYVSLLAPKDLLTKSMEENYADFVSPTLLKEWQINPEKAPGRMVSSPWPDRIDILSIEKAAENAFKVKGEIIEITSVEKENGGVAGKQPITLTVEKINNRWLINKVTLQTSDESNSFVYENSQYGFYFSLPNSWKGYSILTENWEGVSIDGSQSGEIVETGPIILIRHPQWTTQNQRQDIPIMIFSLTQWESLQQEQFHIGAAPIGPKELGRNSSYVFALPARYNYAFLTGFEEVEDILNKQALQPFEINADTSK